MIIKILSKEEKQIQIKENTKEDEISTNSGGINNEEKERNSKDSKININTATR